MSDERKIPKTVGDQSDVSTSGVLFQLVNLVKFFVVPGHSENNGTLTVLDDINLTIPAGRIVGIVGESGSGKTTLMNLLHGLDCPSSGQVLFRGEPINYNNARAMRLHRLLNTAMITQRLNLVSYLNAWENAASPVIFRGGKWREAEQLAMLYLEEMGITEKQARTSPKFLSGGEQQRVAVARALVADSDVILADEPTGNLDGKNTENVIRIFRSLNRDHSKSIIVVTHAVERAVEFCDVIFSCDKSTNKITCVKGD